jgi:hypothetical protein
MCNFQKIISPIKEELSKIDEEQREISLFISTGSLKMLPYEDK